MQLNKSAKIKLYKLYNSKIIVIDNFLSLSFFQKVLIEILELDKISINKKIFDLKRKSNKIEFINFDEFFTNQKKLIKFLSSAKFKKFVRDKLEINEQIYPDKSNMYSGFNIVEKNGFLRPHADFNYNSLLKKYRTVNLLIYFNEKWQKKLGGNLRFYNYSDLKKKYEFLAKANRAVIFLTNKFTPHGYKKITTTKKRISFNYYYYTKKNLSFDKKPHKTIWR